MRTLLNLGAIVGLFGIVSIVQLPPAFAQALQETLPPSVAFYDCNLSSAAADSGSPLIAVQSSSHYLYQAIVNDTTTKEVSIFSYANAGSNGVDSLIAGGWTPSPDTGTILGADYYVSGSVTGTTGGFTLTVWLKDARTRSLVASGTATFASADTTSVRIASSQAAAGILPLITKIRAYQTQQRNANPDLSIDPQINIIAPSIKVAANANVNITIQTVDYDGYPLKNRNVNLHSSKGAFSSGQVQTDATGQATVQYNSGNGDGVAVLSASMDGVNTLAGDSVNVNKQAFILVGNVPLADTAQYYTQRLYELDFNMRVKVAGYTDQSTIDPTDVKWVQANWAEVYSAYGALPGYGTTTPLANDFEFTADTGAVWGTMFKTKSQHNLSIYTDDPCYDSDLLEAETYNGIIDTGQLYQSTVGHLSYYGSGSPGQIYEFYYTIPFIYQGSDDSWGLAAGLQDSHGNCQRGDATSLVYSVDQPYSFNEDFHDADPGASFMKTGDDFTVSFTRVDVTEDTSNSLTGYTYQVIVTNYNATLKPIQPLTAVDTSRASALPHTFELGQNYPNPFNPSTTIRYSLPRTSRVTLKVYDVLGREVKTLVDARQNTGSYAVTFDASRLPSGVYFDRLVAGSFSQTHKMVLMK